MFAYELQGKSRDNVNRVEFATIFDAQGQRVGYISHAFLLWGPMIALYGFELTLGVDWNTVTPSVVRYLFAAGQAYAEQDGKQDEFAGFIFSLSTEHPAYQTMKNGLPQVRRPYAWYLRLPDIAGFLRHIAPALENHLQSSSYAGYSGELKLTFYRSGLLLRFEQGRLVQVEDWRPEPQGHSGDAAFPELTFLQLLFGHRSLEELNYAFPDCGWNHDLAFGLLNAIFPKQCSDIWPVA